MNSEKQRYKWPYGRKGMAMITRSPSSLVSTVTEVLSKGTHDSVASRSQMKSDVKLWKRKNHRKKD